MDRPRSHLTLHLAGGYALLVLYASLHPFAGWRDGGVDPLAFLTAPWPRYRTGFDLVTNVLAYLPLGFFFAAALRRRLPPIAALTAGALAGALLSLALETVQNFLPSRIPSNLDLLCNAGGALFGALAGALWGRHLDSGRLARWRRETIASGRGVDAGFLLVGAWLLTQLSPETLLFGSGNLRGLLGLPPAQPFAAEAFGHVEAAITAAGLLAAGLLAGLLLRRRRHLLVAGLLLAALLLRTLAHALLMGPAAAFSWITPGNAAGLAIGLLLWGFAGFLRPSLQKALAASALLLATVMVNLAPENPYLANALQLWNPGQFLNFNGLTRLLCALWPFLALPWLMLHRAERDDHV